MSVAVRLKDYLEYKKIAPYKAERQCGISSGGISKQLPDENRKEGGSIGSENLEKFLSVYQDISAEWLLRGSGNMIIGDRVDKEQVFMALNMPKNSDKILEVWMQFMDITKNMQDLYKQSILD